MKSLLKLFSNIQDARADSEVMELKRLMASYSLQIAVLQSELEVLQQAEINRHQKYIDQQQDEEKQKLPFPSKVDLTGTSITVERKRGDLCIECNEMPSQHKCRKCKEYVCNACCSSKRELEMVWWCGKCFDEESLSTQNEIRKGGYVEI